jgi:hypothetical protein
VTSLTLRPDEVLGVHRGLRAGPGLGQLAGAGAPPTPGGCRRRPRGRARHPSRRPGRPQPRTSPATSRRERWPPRLSFAPSSGPRSPGRPSSLHCVSSDQAAASTPYARGRARPAHPPGAAGGPRPVHGIRGRCVQVPEPTALRSGAEQHWLRRLTDVEDSGATLRSAVLGTCRLGREGPGGRDVVEDPGPTRSRCGPGSRGHPEPVVARRGRRRPTSLFCCCSSARWAVASRRPVLQPANVHCPQALSCRGRRRSRWPRSRGRPDWIGAGRR